MNGNIFHYLDPQINLIKKYRVDFFLGVSHITLCKTLLHVKRSNSVVTVRRLQRTCNSETQC